MKTLMVPQIMISTSPKQIGATVGLGDALTGAGLDEVQNAIIQGLIDLTEH